MSTGRVSRGKSRAVDEEGALTLLCALGRSTLLDWSTGLGVSPQVLSPVAQRLIKTHSRNPPGRFAAFAAMGLL